MQKLKNIEFLRVFLITAIVFLHMFINRVWNLCHIYPDIPIYQTLKSAIAHSNNGVEGFFIVAGFFLVYTFKSISLKEFILKKYIRLSPVILFSMVLCVIGWLLGVMHFKIIPNLLTVFLLNQFGINFAVGQNPILWYTSVLFAGLLLYFCILKYLPSKIKYILISILIISSYTILEILQHGSFANPLKNYYHVFNVGFIRAVGGIGLGVLCGNIYQSFILKNKIKENIFSKIFISLGFTLLLLLFVMKKGVITKILDKDIWIFLGKFQYSIYVIHYVIIRVLGFTLWKNNPNFVLSHPVLPIIIMILTILTIGVFTYYMVELPCAKFLKDKLIGKKI